VLDVVLAGGIPHEAAWGTKRFYYLRDHPAEAQIFDAFVASFPDDRHNAVAAGYDFSRAALIADIGGGNGEALRRILARFPDARGIVFDREDVVAAIPPEGLAGGRISTQGGSFFDGVPAGADIYLLIRVLHDWADDDASRILRSCRAAMGADGRLLIVDQILEPDPARGQRTDYLVDMQMMAMFGSARERTADEFRALLTPAGFELLRVIAIASRVAILEAAPR
jgi:O-methyltransferase domain